VAPVPPDVLPAWVAEMDVPVAEPVAQALADAVAVGDTGYPWGTTYAEALAEFAAARWGWTFDLGHSAIVPDVMLGIVERVVEAPLTAQHRIDLAALDAAFGQATAAGRLAAYLLCSPHNPTGTVHSGEELTAVAELASRHGVRVVADEIHAPIVYGEAVHLPYLSLPGTEGAFALLSASKAWNLAGLKAAVAVAGPAAAADLARMPEEVSHGPSHLGVIAHSAALRHGGEWLHSLLAGLDANRRLLGELVAAYLPSVRYRRPQATYLAWLDCRALGLGQDPATVFLERGRVALSSGPSFGTGGAGHVRLNFATSQELLTEAVRRIASATS
jgi:cysteine-S-conjugate beta-lyase